jgi:hypothetical protein
VTVTLPQRTLRQLQSIDGDRAKAIVKAVDTVSTSVPGERPQVEMMEMAPGTALFVVPFSRSLRSIPWLTMIEVAPTRHLIAIVPGTPIEKVEIGLLDLIEQARHSDPDEVVLLESLKDQIGELRRAERISKAEILYVGTKR